LLKNRLLAYFKKNPSLKILLKTPYIPLKNTLLQNLDFTLTHFDEISSWLNSKEFKETYADINHPYPPLLNPAKLNDENYPLSYEKIPANLAWEMNLPLPRRYKVVFFMFGASAQSVWHFFTKSFGLNSIFIVDWWRQLYLSNFYSTINKDAAIFSSLFCRYKKQDFKRIYLASHLPFLILVRDPISRLKTMVNHGHYKRGTLDYTFHLNDDIDKVLDRRRFHNNSLYPNVEETMPYLIRISRKVNFSYTSTAKLCQKQVHYIDASEVNPDKVMESMRKYAKFFGKNLDEEKLLNLEIYLKEKKITELRHNIPLTLELGSIQIHLCLKNDKAELKDYTKEFSNQELETLNIIALKMSKEDFKALKKDEKLFNESQIYLNKFIEKLENLRKTYEKTYAKEEDILAYLKSYKTEALMLKKILDKELTHIKANRPDIVNSWKYYKEFEKICEKFL
ncbi:DUF2972 domain-containing protein, partial [Campylobacter upsaliensis]|nr:DUF2972 domain-containing protein [Campylobacter upsaliensis]